MNNTYSLTIKGIIAVFLPLLVSTLKIEIPYTTEEVTNAILLLIGLGSVIVTWVARYRRGDITLTGKKIG